MKKLHLAITNDIRGATLTVALVFLGIFLVLTTSLLSYVQLEITVSKRSIAGSQALASAEAGAEYARWRLAHTPDNLAPETREYRDPQGGIMGTFALEIDERDACNGSVRVLSRGTSTIDPARQRTVAITYGAPALTRYAFLTNANIWFGGGEELKGPLHANGGIRMDAESKSRATSAKQTYICGAEHLCSPPQTKPGIWGSGSGGKKGLWDFPTGKIDFDKIALDLRSFRDKATAANTAFEPSGAFGYHARLNTDGTVTVSRVTAIKPKIWGYDGRTGWVETAEGIQTEVVIRTLTIPEADDCGQTSLLFFEDTLWVDGETKRPVTLIAGRPNSGDPEASIIINGNLSTPSSGTEGKQGSIGIIAQKDVLIPLESPNELELHAAIYAQKGHVFRNYYCSNERLNRYGYKCKASYGSFVFRNTANVKGTVVTNQIAAWTWVNNSGTIIGGYRGGESTYDTRLIFSPPPFFPQEGESRILTWEEINE